MRVETTPYVGLSGVGEGIGQRVRALLSVRLSRF
jgi:hypothetical protein